MEGNLDLFEVINYATVAHKGQIRKTTSIPEITHLYGVGMLLKSYGFNNTIIKAGLLHDIIEDCEDYTLDGIEKKYGKKVRSIVKEVTEDRKSKSWKKIKKDHIESIKTASLEAKIVTAADKIHNLFSLKEDVKTFGDYLWDRFSAPKEEIKWYYKEMYYAVISNVDDLLPIFKQYESILKEMDII